MGEDHKKCRGNREFSAKSGGFRAENALPHDARGADTQANADTNNREIGVFFGFSPPRTAEFEPDRGTWS
jgi:hypothetical protein